MESASPEIRPLSPEERLRALLPERLELAAVSRLLPADRLPHMACLDVGMPNPAMSARLRALGGVWRTVARSPEAAADASAFLGDPSVCCLGADGRVPFPSHAFDAVVVALDILCAVPDAVSFVRECNRILRPDGLLVLSVQARRPFSLADAIRRRIAPAGPHAAVFSEKSLYQLLKSGFNVDSIEAHSRFFLELVRLCDLALETRGASPDERAARL
ncbi:MAG: class I SAM-dependent methyltransferase, partial [Kiritimatiellae bacterium]|nr:class I SAM-dependent methyltransferase [Kiritimatiellia bacterium]